MPRRAIDESTELTLAVGRDPRLVFSRMNWELLAWQGKRRRGARHRAEPRWMRLPPPDSPAYEYSAHAALTALELSASNYAARARRPGAATTMTCLMFGNWALP